MICDVYTQFDESRHSDLYPVFFTCGRWNINFWISGIYKIVWKLKIVVSVITSSFLVYISADCYEAELCSHTWQMFLPFNGSFTCVVQCAIIWYMWNLIEGLVSEYLSSVSWSGKLIYGHLAQHHNTHFQCGHAWYHCRNAHIVAFSISDDLA